MSAAACPSGRMSGHRAGRGSPARRDIRRREPEHRNRSEPRSSWACLRIGSTIFWPSRCFRSTRRTRDPSSGGSCRAPEASSAGSPSSRRKNEQSSGRVGSTPSWVTPRPSTTTSEIIRMHISGCSASCAQPQIADIGFRGDVAHVGDQMVEAMDIGMGGSLGLDAGFIDWIEHAMPVDDVPEALLRVVRRYQAERREGEPFYNWARRTRPTELRSSLAGLGSCP